MESRVASPTPSLRWRTVCVLQSASEPTATGKPASVAVSSWFGIFWWSSAIPSRRVSGSSASPSLPAAAAAATLWRVGGRCCSKRPYVSPVLGAGATLIGFCDFDLWIILFFVGFLAGLVGGFNFYFSFFWFPFLLLSVWLCPIVHTQE